jgi:hypothetical protein
MRVHLTKDGGVADYRTFTWARWRDGYQFEERAIRPKVVYGGAPRIEQAKRLLLSLAATRADPEVYHPLDDSPGISREFSAIKTPEDALRFANRYGLLGLGYVPRMQLGHDMDEAEPIFYWLEEAQRLRHVYKLSDLCQSKDVRGLGKMIYWARGSVTVTFPHGIKRAVVHSGKNSQWLNVWERGDVFGPAKLFIAEEYNSKIDQMASPLLLLDSRSELKPHISPASLLGAMWLEFGEVASGVRKQTVCEYCGLVMDVTNNRSHKRVHDNCSLRVRMARYRQAQKGVKQNGEKKTR